MWQQGYEHALHQSADLKQLLELEELLKFAKQDKSAGHENQASESRSSMDLSEPGTCINGKSSETSKNQNKLTDISNLCSESRGISNLCSESRDASEIHSKSEDNFEIHNGISDKVGGRPPKPVPESGPHINGKSSETSTNYNELSKKSKSADASEICSKSGDNFNPQNGLSDTAGAGGNKKLDGLMNGTHDTLTKLSLDSESRIDFCDTSEMLSKLPVVRSNSGDTSEIRNKPNNKTETHNEVNDEAKRNKKFCVTRISKTKSISVDFRLSRGIAQVSVAFACLIFHTIAIIKR